VLDAIQAEVALGVPLGIELSEIELASVCRRLQAEVLEFLSGAPRSPASAFDGSFGSLANIFQTDPMSPFKAQHGA